MFCDEMLNINEKYLVIICLQISSIHATEKW